jgi:predicted negative regulator of RcsB-dependent stress response
MKKILLLAVAVLVLIGAGVLASRHYQRNQNKEKAAETSEINTANQALEAQKAKNAELLAKYEILRVECERGQDYYGKLTVAIRRTVDPPNCGPAIVQ